MALNLGGDYKSFFIGGPKNGRVVIVDRNYPRQFGYAESKIPNPSAFQAHGSRSFSFTAPSINIKYINYYPHRYTRLNPNTLRWEEYIFMVYEKSKDLIGNKTLDKMVRTGRIKPRRVTDDQGYFKV